MLARCARCQNNFTTDRFGLQKCPHCGSDLMLADPNAGPPPGPVSPPTGSPGPTPDEQRWAPPSASAGGPELPPPPPPPPGGPGGPGGFGGGYGPPPGPPGGPPPGGDLPAPFAERDRLGFFNAYLETWKLVATKPQDFFSRVRVNQPGSAVLFGVLSTTFGSLVQGLYNWVAGQQALVAMQQMMEEMPAEQAEFMEKLLPFVGGGVGTLAQVFLAPIMALVGIYVGGGIIHLLLMLFRGAGRGFDATVTVVAYAYGLQLLLAVPACGGLVALVWMLVVLVIGIAAAQRCGQGKAAAAVLLPGVLACCCCSAAIGVAGMSFVKALSGAGGTPVDL